MFFKNNNEPAVVHSFFYNYTCIENKTYGIDRITGKLIPKERLRAVPHATLSVESKMMQQNKK